MNSDSNRRPLEEGIHRDLDQQLTYSGYLRLDRILNAQQPLSEPTHHDEMLFIIQHQTAELWFKLLIHELHSAMQHLAADEPGPCEKNLARMRQVQRQLFEQWGVLETLTPTEYAEFRHVLGHASGFQSPQYRLVEFMLGNKDSNMLAVFRHDPRSRQRLERALHARSLYDELLAFLARRGHAVPADVLDRDLTQPHSRDSRLTDVFRQVYEKPEAHWVEYALAERLVDVEESFQLWRYRHMKTVERIIGYKHGTGGSSGVGFLNQALDIQFFPELWDVRTRIGAGDEGSVGCPFG